MRFLAAVLVLATLAAFQPAHAASPPVSIAAGLNGAWLVGPNAAFPADLEAGGTAWSSLSPHISAVGGAWAGLSHAYVRWDGGLRATVTDVDNPNFNTFLGLRYRGGSTNEVGPNEWAPDAGFGWRVAPTVFPRLTFVGDAGYGLTSHRVLALLGFRWGIPLK